MRFPYSGKPVVDPASRFQLRLQLSDFIRQRGTPRPPGAPRDIIAQSSSRAVLFSWSLPAGDSTDITGWKLYKDAESLLYTELKDRGTRQCSIECSAGSDVNVFISSVNALGIESQKVQAKGRATTEAGAPSVPGAPPGYSNTGGTDTSGGLGPSFSGGRGGINEN